MYWVLFFLSNIQNFQEVPSKRCTSSVKQEVVFFLKEKKKKHEELNAACFQEYDLDNMRH